MACTSSLSPRVVRALTDDDLHAADELTLFSFSRGFFFVDGVDDAAVVVADSPREPLLLPMLSIVPSSPDDGLTTTPFLLLFTALMPPLSPAPYAYSSAYSSKSSPSKERDLTAVEGCCCFRLRGRAGVVPTGGAVDDFLVLLGAAAAAGAMLILCEWTVL